MSEAATNAAVLPATAPGMRAPPRDELAFQLWRLWRFGQRPEVAGFVRENPPRNHHQLAAVLAVDQHERWHISERVPVEAYFKSFPQFAGDSTAFELILSEIAIRRRLGDSVSLDDYRRRFPQFDDRLADQPGSPSAGTDSEINLDSTVAQNGSGNEPQTLRLPPECAVPATVEEDSTVLRFFQGASAVLDDAARSRTALPELKTVGPYRIERVLARGGMGVIYEAIDTRLKRPAALKMILTGAHSDPESFARFRAEAEAVARLQHPNIVPIFEVGEHDGLPFLALEYIDGQNLAQKLNGQPLPPREAARMLQSLSLAIEFAHQRGIIHRDLKPANILITASGQAKITDFGLAKLRESRDTATRPGEVLGTPNYMAPEQAEGNTGYVGPATDVYSLGALLYELLTGQPPFQAGSPMETLLRVRLQEPISPTHFQPKLPRDLVTICLKCLRKERYQRYATAAELAADLQRFLDGKPVHARSVTYAERLWKWTCRHPALATVIGISSCLLVVANFLLLMQWREAEDARTSSQQRYEMLLRTQDNLLRERRRARAAAIERQRVEYQQRLRVAELEFLTADADNAARILDQCAVAKRGWEWHYLQRHFEGSVLTFTPDGAHLAIAVSSDGKQLLSFRNDGELQTRSVNSGELLGRVRPARPANCPATGGFSIATFSRDRSRLAAICTPGDGKRPCIVIWNVGDGSPLAAFECDLPAAVCLALSGDGKFVAWSEGNWNARRKVFEGGATRLVNLHDRRELWEIANPSVCPNSLAFSPDNAQLAMTGRELPLLVLDTGTGKKLVEPPHPDWSGTMLQWNPNGRQIAVQRGHEILLVSADGRKLATLSGHRGLIYQLLFSRDGNHLASASSDHTIRIWDTNSNREIRTLVGHTQTVLRLSISDDDKRLASISAAGEFKIWDLEYAQEPTTVGNEEHNDWVPAVACHPNGRWFATGCGDRLIHLWDLETGRHLRQFQTRSAVEAIVFHPAGQLMAAGLDYGKVSVWNLKSGHETILSGHFGSVLGVAFHPFEDLLLSWGEDGRVRIWNLSNGQLVRQFGKHAGAVHALALHPSGAIAASADSAGAVRLWRIADAHELQMIQAHETRVASIVYAPNGEWFATSNSNREKLDAETSIHIWDAYSGERLRTLTGHKLSIWHLAVSPDGSRIASAGEDWTVKVWDALYGDLLLTLKGHSDDVRCVKFSPDGRLLISSGDNAFVRVWDGSPLESGPSLRARWWATQK